MERERGKRGIDLDPGEEAVREYVIVAGLKPLEKASGLGEGVIRLKQVQRTGNRRRCRLSRTCGLPAPSFGALTQTAGRCHASRSATAPGTFDRLDYAFPTQSPAVSSAGRFTAGAQHPSSSHGYLGP